MADTLGFKDLNKPQGQVGQQPNQPNQPGQPQNKPKGTGFTNLSRVIGANQNNRLGQAVGGGLQNTAGQARQGVQKAQEQFQQKTQQSLDESTGTRQQALQRVMQDPSQVGDQDYNRFDIYRQGNYGGPNELANKQQLVGNAQEAEQLGGLVGTQGGRAALLQRYAAKNKPYGTGQMALDQTLLGQSAQPQLKQARRSTFGLTNTASRGVSQAEQEAQAKQKAFAQDTGQAVEGTRTQAEQNVADELQRQKNLWLTVNNIRGDSDLGEWDKKGMDLTAEQAQQIGLQEGDEVTRSAWDVINRGGFNEGDINKYNVASQADFNRQQALARLGGKAYSDTDWAGKEAQAQKFQQGFGVQDRNALAAAAQRDRGTVQAFADPLKALAGDFDFTKGSELASAKERYAAAARGRLETADRQYNEALNNSGYNEASRRMADAEAFRNSVGQGSEGDGGRANQANMAYEAASRDYQAARDRNNAATEARNSAYNQYGGYQSKIDALNQKLRELGVGRKVRIKGNQ